MSPRFQGENLDANLALVNSLRRIAEDIGATPAQILAATAVVEQARRALLRTPSAPPAP